MVALATIILIELCTHTSYKPWSLLFLLPILHIKSYEIAATRDGKHMKYMCVAGFCYHVMMLITTRELSYFDITIIIDYVLYFFVRNKPKINCGVLFLFYVYHQPHYRHHTIYQQHTFCMCCRVSGSIVVAVLRFPQENV